MNVDLKQLERFVLMIDKTLEFTTVYVPVSDLDNIKRPGDSIWTSYNIYYTTLNIRLSHISSWYPDAGDTSKMIICMDSGEKYVVDESSWTSQI